MKVNVKHSSPLRYPGGKSVLFKQVRKILKDNEILHYIEPYAGGAGLALSLLYRECVDHITINDFDPRIYSFWKSILEENERFIDKIFNTDITISEWKKQKEIMLNPKSTTLDLGFSAFYLNRCNRSGILIGSGPIGGYDQSGKWKIDARFNKENLAKRIQRIAEYSERISLYGTDAIELIKYKIPPKELNRSLIYFDPPYFNKGQKLYLNAYSRSDHAELRDLLDENCIKSWIMTYDNVEEIQDLYTEYNTIPFSLLYSAAKGRREGKELFIYPDSVFIEPGHISS